MTPDSALPTSRLETGASLAEARPWQAPFVTLDGRALDVMTDLTQVKAATVSPGATLHQAEQTMINQGVRMLFVVTNMPEVEGLITSTDLRGERPMRLVHQRGVRYDELTVADVMTSLAMLDAIDIETMRTARVSHVIGTLKRFGRNHLLVVERGEGGSQRVRGVVSRTQIERQLGQRIDITEIAGSFAEIEKALV